MKKRSNFYTTYLTLCLNCLYNHRDHRELLLLYLGSFFNFFGSIISNWNIQEFIKPSYFRTLMYTSFSLETLKEKWKTQFYLPFYFFYKNETFLIFSYILNSVESNIRVHIGWLFKEEKCFYIFASIFTQKLFNWN